MDELTEITPDEVRASLRTYFAGGAALDRGRANRDTSDDSGSGAAGFDSDDW